jgi:rifampicin phosphotransferase
MRAGYRRAIEPRELTWASPDGGTWWLEAAHFPLPVSRLFAEVIDRICEGWFRGAKAYGMPRNGSRWGHVNGYLFYGESGESYPGDAALAERAVRERWWMREYERWMTEERPAAAGRNRQLQAVDVATLELDDLADHVRDALRHLLDVGPLHFAHRGRELVRGELRKQAEAEGISFDLLTAAFAGGSPATSRPTHLVAAIADALRNAGLEPASVRTLDDVRTVPGAAGLLDAYLDEFGHRLLDSYDLACPTLHERPEIVVAAIRAAAPGGRPDPDPAELPPLSDELQVLLDEARLSYGIEDDDDGVCIFWPSGLLRRALLELARRRGLPDPSAIFEVDVEELHRLLEGDGPSDEELASRLSFRRAAAAVRPPTHLGPAPPGSATSSDSGHLTGTGVGEGVARGRACVVRGLDSDGLADLEPGDVLIAVTTNPGYNAVMPILAAVATETHMGHTVICARELGIPAVVGVAGLVDAIPHLATVEVDAARGTVRLID